jgi:hypothetical protein
LREKDVCVKAMSNACYGYNRHLHCSNAAKGIKNAVEFQVEKKSAPIEIQSRSNPLVNSFPWDLMRSSRSKEEVITNEIANNGGFSEGQ